MGARHDRYRPLGRRPLRSRWAPEPGTSQRRSRAPDATYAGYTIWTGFVPYDEVPGWQQDRDYWNMISLPNGDGAMIVGESQTNANPRRYIWQWYDPTSDDYLRAAGALHGTVAQRSLVDEDIAEAKYDDIDGRASHWPEPSGDIVRTSVRLRRIIATPITEYVPRRLAHGRIAIIGDAAHVPSPMTGAGFDTGLADAEALGELTKHGVAGARGLKVLKAYETQRLKTARRMVQSGQSFGRHLLGTTNGW